MLTKFSSLKFAFKPRPIGEAKQKPFKETDFRSMEASDAMKKNAAFNVFFNAHVSNSMGNIEYFEYVAVEKKQFDYAKFANSYGITPNYKILDTYVFILPSYVNRETYGKYARALSFAIGGESVLELRMPGSIDLSTGMEVKCEKLSDEDCGDLSNLVAFVTRFENMSMRNVGIERENVVAMENAMKMIVMETVFKRLGIFVNSEGFINGERGWFYDDEKRIVIDVSGKNKPAGNQFFFVLSHKGGAVEETLLWFQENAGAEVTVDTESKEISITEIEEYGYHITSGNGFMLQDGGYFTTSETPKKFTDFSVRVYYRIINDDGTVDYVVTIANNEETTDKILYKHTSSANALKDFVTSYGNYHFFGSSADSINQLHSAIASAPVTTVNAVVGYGFHKGKLILHNGVFDLKTKEMSVSKQRESYVFDSKGNGYLPCTPNGVSMKEAYEPSACHTFNPDSKTSKPEEQWEVMRNMYKGNVGLYLLTYAWGLMGYGMYREMPEVKMPFLMVHGVRGSGKTEYAEILRRIYGVEYSYNFETTSAFVTATLFSSFAGLPTFLGEYREDSHSDKRKVKMSKFRSIYDKQSETKGRANQTTVTYPYTSTLVIEGEEGISDSAMRSRCVIVYLTRANKLDDFSTFKKYQSSDVFENMLYSYLRKTPYDYSAYDAAFRDGIKLFPFYESRLTNTMARVYAGCVTYAPHMKDKIVEVLKELFEIQAKDFKNNDPIQKFMKKVAFNLTNINESYDVQGTTVYLNASKIEEYFRVKRVELDMGSFDTYVQYCDDYGFKEGIHDFGFGMGRSIEIDMEADNFPQPLMIIREVYDYFKKKNANGK